MLTKDVIDYINRSVLCWLATSSENIPNVSPKEIFNYYGEDIILIANIASPGSIKNILANPNVCVSFIDILVQKGYQIKGTARLVKKGDTDYTTYEPIITKMTKGLYPFSSIIEIKVLSSKQILAPSYILKPGTSEVEQIAQAKIIYGL